MPASFASAAAGSMQSSNTAREGASEWSRRPNGATQTFRRQSNTNAINTANTAADTAPTQSNPARYVPPHRNGTTIDSRYSKSQLLGLYRSQQGPDGGLKDDLAHLYVSGWQPEVTNGAVSSGWGRGDHARDVQPGPEVCWDREGAVEPLGLTELDEAERELFSNSVNTPLKPPTQNKENVQANGLPSRKLSIGGITSPGAYGLPSPSTTRTGMRRRETSESYPFPSSITSPIAGRDERGSSPPPSLLRRKTDMKDEKADDDRAGTAGFGSLRRGAGPLSAGINGPSSPWSSTPGFAAMGAFQQDKRPGIGSGRAESRFKGVLSKDSSEDIGGRGIDRKGSMSSLHKVEESDNWRTHDRNEFANDTLDEADEDTPLPSGSAALGLGSDASPSRLRQGVRGFDTPNRGNARDEHGFGAFGMTADHAGFGNTHQTPAHRAGGQEPMSPTDTNPYQSPEAHGGQHNPEEHEEPNARLSGLGGFQSDQHLGLGGLGAFSGLGGLSGSQGPASDRSQTSSVGPARGFPGLGGLGQIGGLPGGSGWPQNAGGFAGNRQGPAGPSPFGQNIFSSETQSPGLAGLGGLGSHAFGQHAGGRMASMFPQGMQEQMGHRDEHDARDFADDRSVQTFGTIGQSHSEHEDGDGQLNQPPPLQQRTMVMPDRMRWIYKDPQGQTQGPWSGLEMHDWYRAGFFSPELLVKKAEDADYEPLAQLIRRIGNSREPFLVPQIGIPHGPPSTQGPWAGAVTGVTNPGAQPPFASSFPSFGTTLTAEQQNALERRKQEEQYLMARQKEHLAQAQIAQRMQLQGHGFGAGQIQALNHHSSAQSLHSQPSIGSMTSPSAYQPSPSQGPITSGHGMYDAARGAQTSGIGAVGAETLGHIREEEIPNIMDRLSLGRAPNQFGAPGQPFGAQAAPRNVQQMLQDRAMLQQEQARHDAAHQDQPSDDERLREFQQLQGQVMEKQYQQVAEEHEQGNSQEPLSLTEQVQKAASAKQSPAATQQAWGKIEAGFPQGFPPAPSQSPLPAPAAQRTGRQSVADQLAQESSRSHTPNLDTPSAAVAPWAKEPSEVMRGPSLKEIQEMEAKKAAELEEIAAATRRAVMQRELEAQAILAASMATVQPGLPAGANWATGSPATPTGTSPWAKATVQKPALVQTKSMAQIQKEEEARKKKIVAAQAQANASAMAAVPSPAGGKSYATLASKTGTPAPPPITTGGAWTTVGASGKAKTPASTPVTATRAVSSGLVPTVAAAGARKTPVRSATMSLPGVVNAQDEFRKWAIAELRPDLNKGISAEDFVGTLISLGADHDIITEAVHMSSNTIDSRHFAEEFIRRKKLADKGMIDASAPPKSVSPSNTGGNTAGGWSEVAKKGPFKEPVKEESNGSFRVVASKKKGSKRV